MGHKLSLDHQHKEHEEEPPQVQIEDNLTAVDWYDRAMVDVRINELDCALECLNRAILMESQYVNAYLERGKILKHLGKKELAFFDVSYALKVDPGSPVAYILRGTILEDEGELEMAISDFSQAITLRPHDRIAYLHRGKSLFLSRKYHEAIQDYNRVLLLNPRDPMAYRNRALSHRYEGSLDASLNDLNKSIELDPLSASAYLNRSVVVWMRGPSNDISNLFPAEAARSDYNRALQLEPNIALKALVSTSKLIRLHPGDFYHHLIRGVLHHLHGNVNAASADHFKALELNPMLVETHSKLFCCVTKEEEKQFTDFLDGYAYYGGPLAPTRRRTPIRQIAVI